MKYGVFDTKEEGWLGDEKGPRTFDDFTLARVAAQIAEVQLTGDYLGCRIKAKEFPDGEWKLRDTSELKYTSLEALQKIEGGTDRTEDEERIREVEKRLNNTPGLPFWKEIK
jgi:hypothetical protein